MDTSLPPVLAPKSSRRFGVVIKVINICVLIVLLIIPLALTQGVLHERQAYKTQATEEIAGIWGRAQLVSGPVLAVPYVFQTMVSRSKVVNGQVVQFEEPGLMGAMAYFLPEDLDVTGSVTPEIRHRGIYDTVVYSARLQMSGRFKPDFQASGLETLEIERIEWDRARVLLGVTDLHGIRSVEPLRISEGVESSFESTDGAPDSFLPLAAKLAQLSAGAELAFTLNMAVQGSERLNIAPLGRTTTVEMQSPWMDPSFVGASLPTERELGTEGFKARWESAHFSRGFPQAWSSRKISNDEMSEKIRAASFGVRFAQLTDNYSFAERAQKYGMLFFVLIFAAFFLFEVTSPALRIHPLQYALVGAALALFFLGFLALSEFWNVGNAYAVAAATCTILVTLYAWSFLRAGWRAMVICAGLGATYGCLFFVLQSQDYALISGTLALFAALALVMFFTRRIDWYAVDSNLSQQASDK